MGTAFLVSGTLRQPVGCFAMADIFSKHLWVSCLIFVGIDWITQCVYKHMKVLVLIFEITFKAKMQQMWWLDGGSAHLSSPICFQFFSTLQNLHCMHLEVYHQPWVMAHDQDSWTNIITIAMTIACCEKFIRVDPHRRVRDPVQLPLTCY